MDHHINIGDAAKAVGVSPKMIRHYEQIGLLPEAERSDSGYRLYGERELSVLRFIRQSRRLGFSMEQIAQLIGMWGDDSRTSREVKAVAQQHLEVLDEKLHEIQEMKIGLERLVRACKGDEHARCAILENLAVDSPTAPKYKARVIKNKRKNEEHDHVVRQKSSASSGSHIDLMAWMRGVHL